MVRIESFLFCVAYLRICGKTLLHTCYIYISYHFYFQITEKNKVSTNFCVCGHATSNSGRKKSTPVDGILPSFYNDYGLFRTTFFSHNRLFKNFTWYIAQYQTNLIHFSFHNISSMYLTLPPILSSCHFNFGINFIIAYASKKFACCFMSASYLEMITILLS